MYNIDQIVWAFSPESPIFFTTAIALIIAMTFGLLEYAWATRLSMREHKTPFPVWMHAFMFAHDMMAGAIMLYWGIVLGFFWYFMLQGVGMLTWMFLEVMNMRTAIKYETEETWGKGTTKKQSIIYTLIVVFAMICFVNIMRYLMDDTAAFLWLPITNFVMAIAPGFILFKRKSREGSSVMLYIFILGGTIFNFLPCGIGLFTTVLPEVFNQPIYFAIGIVATIIAIYNLCTIVKMPPKKQLPGEKKPIW